jgi:hypothetical protein
MSETADNPAVPTGDALKPTTAKKPRGRPAGTKSGIKIERKADHPQHRIDQLKAELEKAQEALREFEAKQAEIVGKAVIAHALANADYRKQLAALLRKEITGKGDLATIDTLLI